MMNAGVRGLLRGGLKPPVMSVMSAAPITSKTMRKDKIQLATPFPYKTKRYTLLHCMLDNTTKRFNENTKVIVVEGNIGAGKSAVAKKLADELDMLHMPEATIDQFYINDYGFDLRTLDHRLPPGARSFCLPDFYKNPNHRSVAKFQLQTYQTRYLQYVDALCHVLNTGQGVVLERCPYSDAVFMETMRKFDYVSRGARGFYRDVLANTLPELLRPHLVIYLDVPVNVALERIKKRNLPHEVGSKVLTKEYLTTLEDEYRKYLNEISKHAELLVYDWSNFGDVEVVVEDVERIDFDSYDKYDEKMKDWRMMEYWDIVSKRYTYTTRKNNYILSLFLTTPIRTDAPEVFMTTEEADASAEVWQNAPGSKYHKGYNEEMGDTGILWKRSRIPRLD